jgi:type VI secretion system protein ImpF
MRGFAPGLFDRLMANCVQTLSGETVFRHSMEELKDAVARDLEALLNTRTVMQETLWKSYPECHTSIMTYGLNDFAGLSLASTDDRAYICRCLEQAIARHEPRLRNAQAFLEVQEGAVNRINFAISAMLVVHAAREPVSFDAVLQPSTLHYSISKTRRTARMGD